MERWLPGIVALLVLVILFLAFESHRHWVFILLILFIIFYALFANPMKHTLPKPDKKIRAKRTSKKRGKKKK